MNITFNKPHLTGHELTYMAEAVQQAHISGDGPFTRKCHAFLKSKLGVNKPLLTTSCTHALEMAALLLDIHPEDEVIAPSFTFVSTINAFVLRGARPVFCDIRPDTLNIDESLIEACITPRTKAIIPVHYGGVGCEMDSICAISRKYNIPVIEDNAHGLFGRYKGKFLGTFGIMATQSFHETKNIHCGEGGALLINDQRLIERAEILREKGTNRSRFFRGEVDKYTWVDVGSSYLPSDLLAAFLWAQLEHCNQIQEKRRALWERYAAGLDTWSANNGIQLPTVPPHCEQTFHLFYLLLPDIKTRQALITHLKGAGIQAVFHYLPLHTSPMGHHFNQQHATCPVTEKTSDCLLRLPFYNDLTESEQWRIIEVVQQFRV